MFGRQRSRRLAPRDVRAHPTCVVRRERIAERAVPLRYRNVVMQKHGTAQVVDDVVACDSIGRSAGKKHPPDRSRLREEGARV